MGGCVVFFCGGLVETATARKAKPGAARAWPKRGGVSGPGQAAKAGAGMRRSQSRSHALGDCGGGRGPAIAHHQRVTGVLLPARRDARETDR